MTKKDKIAEDTADLINVFQACNHFQLSEMNRRVTEKKYEASVMSEADWEQVLSDDKLL